MAMGTAGYMSPEQLRGEQLDARTDLFSFGLILYEMATGQRAFHGNTAAILKDAILNQTPVPIRELTSAVPLKLEEAINKALQKDRELRYRSAADMLIALIRLQRVTAGARRRLMQLVAVAIFSLVLVAGTAFWFNQNIPPSLPELKQRQLTTNSDDNPVRHAWISPDGKQLAYSDHNGLHVKLLATGDIHTLVPPDALKGVEVEWSAGPWSRDGSRLLSAAYVPVGAPARGGFL
jgi:serine/threonine protein kinase